MEQVDPKPDWLILEVGFGQGYLTMELASILSAGKVVGIDVLRVRSTIAVTPWIGRQMGMERRMALFIWDAIKLPLEKEASMLLSVFEPCRI
ncbi:MAG: class I SAM-dependent methyltransferase [Candidatus Bathyarchaeia archaeon]